LLEAGAEIEAPTFWGMTPFCVAAWQGHVQCVYFLSEAGANKDQPTLHDEITPLHYAAHNNHLEIVRFLVEAGSNKDQPDLHGKTPMHFAASEGHLDMVKLLVVLWGQHGSANFR
jgi:ankyrin repeat protein